MKKRITITLARRLVWREYPRRPAGAVIDVGPQARPIIPVPAPVRATTRGWWARVIKLFLPLIMMLIFTGTSGGRLWIPQGQKPSSPPRLLKQEGL